MIGEIWRSRGHLWICRRDVGEAKPGEPLRQWECVSLRPGRHRRTFKVGHVGTFGDAYVRSMWTRAA